MKRVAPKRGQKRGGNGMGAVREESGRSCKYEQGPAPITLPLREGARRHYINTASSSLFISLFFFHLSLSSSFSPPSFH